MNMIIQRKDHTSICCSLINQRHNTVSVKTKILGFIIACSLIVAGFFIIIMTV